MRATFFHLGLTVVGCAALMACAQGVSDNGAGGEAGGSTGGEAGAIDDGGSDVTVPDDGSDVTVPDDGVSNPCEGIVCDKPPANACADSAMLTVFDANGACDQGQCQYASHPTACPNGCVQDACAGDPCVGVTCMAPPANYCTDAAHLSVYEPAGSCTGGTCGYAKHDEYCSFGCLNDVCDGDPCVGVACNTAPANYCTDATHFEVNEVPGSCANGTCAYGHHNEFCQFGCSQGVCNGDPCQGVSCTTAPSDYCVDAATVRQYAASGTCNAGSCGYPSNDVTCPLGCSNGACAECVTQTDCVAGKWCNGTLCQSCGTNQHCGSSCTDCTQLSPTQKCDAAGTICIQCTSDGECGAGAWCSSSACVPCNTAQRCGASCSACSGLTPDCNGTACYCASGSCGPPCPSALSIGEWTTGADGWSWDGLWRRDGSNLYMVAGSTISYSSSYTQNLTYDTALDLSSCGAAQLSFSVRLADDASYENSTVDKSERLYVQCSGDGGANWTNLVPSPWPSNQSPCSDSYCCGANGSSRSFGWTSQSIALPDTCRKATARIRFQAKGQNVWRLMNPGWYVDAVKVN